MKDLSDKKLKRELSPRKMFDLLFGISLLIFAVHFLLEPSGLQRDVFFAQGYDLLADFLNTVRHITGGQPYADGHIQPPLGFLLLHPFKYFADFNNKLEVLHSMPGAMFAAIFFMVLSEAFLFFMLKKFLKNGRCIPVLLYFLFSSINLYAVERGTNTVLLAHLSSDNNTPSRARSVVEHHLKNNGIDPSRDIQLAVAPRSEPGVLYQLERRTPAKSVS